MNKNKNQQNKERYARHKENGICVYCNEKAVPGVLYCVRHQEKICAAHKHKTLLKRELDTSDPLLIYRSPRGTLLKYPMRIGDKVGEFTVMGLGDYVGTQMTWRCKCSCGVIRDVCAGNLLSGKSKTCGTGIHSSQWNPNRLQQAKISLLTRHKIGAKRRKLCWELPDERFFFLIEQKCTYCGVDPYAPIINWANPDEKTWPNVYWNGIDRRDSSKGYTKENSVPCCRECNKSKLERNEQDFAKWVEKVYHYYAKKHDPVLKEAA